MAFNGAVGFPGQPGSGVGGGLFLDPAGSASISNTSVSGNEASTSDHDVHGTFTAAG
jgi:hypothetical protein